MPRPSSFVYHFVQIVLGGLAGIAAAGAILFYGFGIDFFGVKGSFQKATAEKQAVAPISPIASSTGDNNSSGPSASITGGANAPEPRSASYQSAEPERGEPERPNGNETAATPELAPVQKSEPAPTEKPPSDATTGTTLEAPAPPTATIKNDPPDKAQRDNAQKKIGEILGADIADAKTAARKSELAKKLLSVGRETRGDPPTRFLLYEHAGEIAASCADVETAMRAADAILEEFTRVDSLDLKEPLLQKAAVAVSRNKAQHAAIASASLDLLEAAITADKLEVADRLWKLAQSESKSAGESTLKMRTDTVGETLAFLRSQAAEYHKQRETLERDPKNPEANSVIGRYLLFGKRQREGLLNLQRGSDETLKRLAELEAAEKPTTAEMYDLAEGWRKQADSTKEVAERRTMLELALSAYRQCVNEISGLDRANANKQIEKLTKEGFGDVPPVLRGNPSPAAVKESTNSRGMKFVYCPPGKFLMGSPASELSSDGKHSAAESQRKVTLTRGYYLGATEVTQVQWKTVMGSEPWKGMEHVKEGADYPATYVSWEECVEFCKKLSTKEKRHYRLPTEAEWEYACRAATTTAYSFGKESRRLGEYAWFAENALDVGEKYAHPVGQKKANGFGLYDMHGNVWEWCADYYDPDYYLNSPRADPSGPSAGARRVIRGGYWGDLAPDCRASFRGYSDPTSRYYHFGFRVALVVGVSRGGRP